MWHIYIKVILNALIFEIFKIYLKEIRWRKVVIFRIIGKREKSYSNCIVETVCLILCMLYIVIVPSLHDFNLSCSVSKGKSSRR